MALKFEYCECGCKGWAASAGSLHYWITDHGYVDGKKGYAVHNGHGWISPAIAGGLKSYEEATKAANKHARAEFRKIARALA